MMNDCIYTFEWYWKTFSDIVFMASQRYTWTWKEGSYMDIPWERKIEIPDNCKADFVKAMKIGYYKEFYR